MIKFQLADGTYKNVKPEHLDIFKERYPDATEVGSGMDIPTPITQEGLTVHATNKDVGMSKTDLFINAYQQMHPGHAKALSGLAGHLKGWVDIAENIANFGEMAVEMQIGRGGPLQTQADYFAKRLAASAQGVTVEEFDETNPYNIVQLGVLSNVLDKAIIKHVDKETGKQLDFMDLFQKGEYGKSAESFVYEVAGAAPSMIISRLPGGYALLGGGSFAEKLHKDLIERPDQTAGKILTNAIVYGGSDAVGEYFGGRFLNKLAGVGRAGGKEGLKRAKDVMIGGVGAFIKTAFKGGSFEAMQEAITSVIQTGGDDLIYGDEKTSAEYFRKALHSGLIGFALGGSSGTMSLGMNKANKTNFYEYIAPKTYKKDQVKLSELQEEAESDLKNAPNDKKDFFQKRVDDIKKKKEDLKNELYQSFEDATETQLEYHLDNLQTQHDQLDIITGGDKYSKTAKDDAKKKFLEAANNNESLFAVTDIDYQAVDDLNEGITSRTAEKLRERRNNLWFKAKDLDIEFVDTQEKFDKLIEEKGAAVALTTDGFAEIIEDGKTKIVINEIVATSAEAANVIGHELLHYAISNRFANNPKGMRESIVSFRDYIKQLDGGDYILKSLEKSFINGDYALLDKNGNVQYDSDGLVIMQREQDVEEYFNKFSDLIDSEAIKSVKEVSSGLLNNFRTMARGLGVGIKNIDFKDGQQVFELLIDYNKNINRKGLLGAITQRKAIKSVAGEKTVAKKDQVTEKDKVTKASRSTVNLDIGEGDLSQRIDILTKGAKTQSEFQQPGGAFDNIYSGILEGKFDRIFGEGISPGQRVIQRQNLADRLINYNPAKTPELSKWLYGGSGKAGNVVYAGLVAKKKLFEAGEKTKREVRIDTEEAKQLEDKPTKTKKAPKIEPKARKLTSLADIDIDRHPLIKEATKVELKRLIESNPKNLTEEIQKVLIPDLVEIIRQEMGVIGEKAGELNIPDTYYAYLADSYVKTISSMEILKIRTNYKNLFKKEKMGFEDYKTEKSNKPSLKKDSNYRKDIFKNITNKALFTKYHTEGKKNKLIANQRNLALMRAEAEVVRATENYIIENSSDLNQVYAAELRNFIDSKTVQKQKEENKSFDSVKFSKNLSQQSLNQVNELVNLTENNIITDVWNLETQQPIKGKYDPEIIQIVWNQVLKGNIYSDKSKALVDIIKKIPKNLIEGNLGTVMEQYKINVGIRAAKIHKGLTMLGEWVMEGGIPDFFADIYGFALFAEGKFGTSRGGKTTTNETNWKTGKFLIKKKLEGNIEFVEKSVKKALKKSDQLVKDLKKLGFDIVDQDTVVDLKTHKDLGAKKAVVSDASVIVNEDYIGRIYANKEFPVYLIDIDGAGLYYMPGDPFVEALAKELGIPKLEGKFPLITRILPQKVTKNKKTIGYKYKLTTEPLIDPSNLKVKSDFSFSDIKTFDAIMNSKTVARLKKQQEAKNKQTFNSAVNFSRSTNNESKGITVLDFDDTLATTKSLVKFTRPDGTTGTLNAEEYASTYEDLLKQGYKFDFTEFDKVVKAKLAPLFNKALKLQKKFGPENMFILTARPPAAQKAIYDFLKANGLNIPIKNITGLGNSTAEAKALWVAEKVGEGYNDFYFADDALQNTQAVQNMLDQFDVKSKVQQAKIKFSKSMNTEFNNILEDVVGIDSKKRFSAIKARKRGESKGKFRLFIPPSHEDFVGLLYNFIGKGKKGNQHRNFFEQALVRPLNRAYRELNTAKQSIANDYKALNKEFKNVKKKLTKKTPDGDFTYQDAIRVYLFDKHGYKVPGLTKTDQQKLVDLVMEDTELQTYAETLNIISKQEAYVKPSETWETGDIRVDLDDATGRVGREQFFTEFFENADVIFSEDNLNKIEAAYGEGMVSAIKDILYRTKTGRNRPSGQNKLVNGFLNYLNGSVASTMFFNIRSAVLQQMSMVNFINFADNNIFAAAKAFANLPQYYNDWAFIFNSDFMKQRRGGIKTDVNGAELAASLKGAKNTPRALLAKLLQLGFLPTQIGDNVAIATGGATFYRNRINTYLKQGLTQKEAESKAWIDFQILAEATQQSARPDMVSQQQASPLGKIILAFQNVTSQFNRIGKKGFLDIYHRRITPGNTTQFQSDISNLSRISYYFVIQNLVFYSLQSALFMAMFDDDEDDERWLKKKERVINGSIDSVLRGTGVWGAVAATLKNMAIKWHEQREKGYNADESAVLMEMLNVSPPLGIKARKLVNAERTLNYNKKVIDEMETFDIDNPQWSAYTNYIESTTNIPLNRLYNKTQNVRQSLNNQNGALQRVLMFGGWSQWNLGIENEKMEKIKEKTKKKKKRKGKTLKRKTLKSKTL